MTNGVTAMYDAAEHYEELAKHFGEKVRFGDGSFWWPYNMDSKHYEELKARYLKENKNEV